MSDKILKNILLHYSINQVDKEKWKFFYKKHSQSNPYQTFEMFEFWNNQKDCTAFIFLLETDKGECLAICTGAIVFKGKGRIKFQSMSALIYGGPLIKEGKNKKEILNFLLPKIEEHLKFKTKNIEFRNFFLDIDFKEIFIKNNWKYTPKVNYIINLTTEDEVFKNFHRNKRKQIRKALREDIQISHDKTFENAKGIYDVLENIYKINFDEFLLPLPDLNFLLNLLSLENTGLTAVRCKGKVIGGEFFLFDTVTIYGWFGGGLNIEYKKQSPMSVVNWATMKYGLEKGLQFFDYGGAGIKGKENRLRIFKSAFGGELIENGMFSKINLRYLYKAENKIYRLVKYFGLFDGN